MHNGMLHHMTIEQLVVGTCVRCAVPARVAQGCGGMAIPTVLSLVETALYGAAIGIGGRCYLKIKDVYGQDPYAKQQAQQQVPNMDTEEHSNKL